MINEAFVICQLLEKLWPLTTISLNGPPLTVIKSAAYSFSAVDSNLGHSIQVRTIFSLDLRFLPTFALNDQLVSYS